MVTVGMNYCVVEGKESAFEKAFAGVHEALVKTPGHQQTRLYREVSQPDRYLIISQWSDRDAYEAFISSDAFRAVANWGKEGILAERPDHRLYGDL